MKQILRVIIFILIIEGLLRLGGVVLGFFQDYQNNQHLKASHEYRILCLGDSITNYGGYDSYPNQLQRILNARQDKFKMVVIDKGITSASSERIAEQINKNLDEYKPQILVLMEGLNDKENTAEGGACDAFLASHWAVYKLIRTLVLGVINKARHLPKSGIKPPATEEPSADLFQKMLAVNPENYFAWYNLGVFYQNNGDLSQAIAAFEKALMFCSNNMPGLKIKIYRYLESSYAALGQKDNQMKMLRQLLAYQPNDEQLLRDLGLLYIEQNDFVKAKKILQVFVYKYPNNDSAYANLAACCQALGEEQQAIKVILSGIKMNPDHALLYSLLGKYLMQYKYYAQAESILKDGLAVVGTNLRDRRIGYTIQQQLLKVYEIQGKDDLARQIKAALIDPSIKKYDHMQLIKDIVVERRIQLILVQYPTLPLAPLQKEFRSVPGVLFVDNEDTFNKALAKGNYYDYFIDHMGGTFGHGAPKGNRLLAENVAGAILQYLKIENR